MHIRDGILSPEVCLVTGLLSLSAIGFSLRKLRFDLEDRAVPLTGMLAAVIFAGQMVNFPLIGLPVSGHLLGGVLASVILGPWAGCLAISLVLIVQAVLFNDGGLLSLGANILNMGVVGAWGGYAIYATLRQWMGNRSVSAVPAAVIAAWLSVLAAATLFCVEFGLSAGSRGFSLRSILTLMVLYHALIGVGEALITGGIVGFVLSRRPDLVPSSQPESRAGNVGAFAIAGFMAALAVAAFVAPFASENPDGLDMVAETTGMDALNVEREALVLDDYAIPGLEGAGWPMLATSLAGVLGTTAVFAIALTLGKAARWNSPALAADGVHGN
ncbi:energy-coupling factor ABC transporter permease [Schlesneria sp.]|uniref:energy-coupling factor ABC transporter permease n=1 Tax=Schlesneria sp. TaxID=2762018 RepID=UPI002F1B8948